MGEKFDQAAYVRQYQRENRVDKKVTFNRLNPADMELLDWLSTRPEGMVQYLKSLIRSDMRNHQRAGK